MVYQRLFYQLIRYKTLRCFVCVAAAVAFFVNVRLFLSTSVGEESNDMFLRDQLNFLHPAAVASRFSRIIARDPRRARDTDVKMKTIEHDGSRKDKDKMLQRDSYLSKDSDPYPPIPPDCHVWCSRNVNPPYKLSAVLLVRVYRNDLAGLSTREVFQWLFYLRYAGFEHVFVYDAYVNKIESQYHVLKPLVQSGYVTYVDWSAHNPYTIKGTQISAYQHCLDKYGANLTWHMALDIDEYPFSPLDTEPNFMLRFLEKFFSENLQVSQVTLQNYLFLGKPLDEKENVFLISRLRRRTLKKGNDLGKSVFQVAKVSAAQVHHNNMRAGKTVDCDAHVIRLNHYWGARLQNWGNDTKRILDITQPDFSIQRIVERLKSCAKCFIADRLYVKSWN